MLKTRLTGAMLVCLALDAIAAPIELPLGPSMGFGNVTIPSSLLTLSQNPAAPSLLDKPEGEGELVNSYGLGAVGVGVEMGDWGTVLDRLDALSTIDPNNINPAQLSTIVDQVNTAFSSLSDLGYVKASVAADVPLFPMVYTTAGMKGFYLSADVSTELKLRYLDSPVQITGPSSISMSGALYTKSVYRGDVALGYSQGLMSTPLGEVYIGGRLNAFSLGLSKDLTGSSIDIANPGASGLSVNPNSFTYQQSTGVGMDLGLILSGNHLQAGLTLANLGNPSFSYPAIGQNCATDPDPVSCYIAVAHSNEISLMETYVMLPQFKLEAAMHSSSKNFYVATALDLNPINDAMGDPIQWFTLSSAFLPRGWSGLLAPQLRMGVRRNLVGSQMNYINLGLTLFKSLTLDLAQSLNTTTINSGGSSTTTPRSYMLSFGFAFNF